MVTLFCYAFRFANELGGKNLLYRIYLFFKNIFCVSYWKFISTKEFEFNLIYKSTNFTVYLDQTIDIHVLGEIFIDKEYSFNYGGSVQIIVDIGSNIGLSCVFFNILFPNAIIHAIEPNNKLRQKFNKNTSHIKNIVLHNLAINKSSGEALLKLGENHLSSSLLVINHSNESIVVKTETLESFFRINNLDCVDILKFDIEGGESFILSNPFYKVHTKIIVGEIHKHILEKNNISLPQNSNGDDGWHFIKKVVLNNRVILFGSKKHRSDVK
ncbi:MAG: FkbM family methyltransferase [Patescibacteria group bacterium]